MQLEAVVVCVDYSDFLEHTLPANLPHFDRVVVVTTPEDKRTQGICSRYGVTCIDTRVFFEDGDRFNKGRAINLGLAHLRHVDWLVHLDADIVLPERFRTMADKARLDPRCIYGIDRVNCRSYDAWARHKLTGDPQYLHHFQVQAPKQFEFAARIVPTDHGWCPIGFFQLWHSSAGRRYPIHQGSAEHTDVLFAVQWPRPQRVLLPDVIGIHLETGSAQMGANWQGRKTPRFGPAEAGPPAAECGRYTSAG